MAATATTRPTDRQTIGPMVARRQAELGLTDLEAGERLGVTQATVTRWRLGRAVPSDVHVKSLAAFLGVTQRDVRAALDRTPRPTSPGTRPGTLGDLLRRLENERNLTGAEAWQRYGIDKSRYYRLRSDLGAPHPTDIPALALAIGVPEDEVVMAAYRTELWRADQRR